MDEKIINSINFNFNIKNKWNELLHCLLRILNEREIELDFVVDGESKYNIYDKLKDFKVKFSFDSLEFVNALLETIMIVYF
jgi:hypothetical protein